MMSDQNGREFPAAPDAAAGSNGHGGATNKPPGGREVQSWLVSKLSERLGLKPEGVDVRKPFTSYGLSSRDAVELAGELAAWLGRRLSPTLIYEYPSVEALSNYLSSNLDSEEQVPAAVVDLKAESEPVAIIGVGCRFPGAQDPEEFWHLLRDGKEAVTEFPDGRRELLACHEAGVRRGGFLKQVDSFDAQFFGISPREGRHMDPQQRQLLEVAWEALEDAGQAAERLNGSPTGVFVGISSNDYYQLQLGDPDLDDPYLGTGNALSIAANRLSYFFGFRGPSLSIDTACSSSLVAVHLACRSLHAGESTLALAGGVNLILSPTITDSFAKAGFLSPEGRCKAFDASADGYVRGEGAGVVVLKLLSQALADGDPVYAVISGGAVNQDGRTNGLTAPSRQAQEDVLRQAYSRAGVSPGQIQYVEAHGTGTALGDPIEAKALGAVLRNGRAPGGRCAIGSVKTNIGHLEAAAGVAGLIKVALSLKHRLIPPSLHFKEPNPYIPFQTLPLYVQQSLTPWPEASGRRRAGVSSFGFGGTNAHVVLEEASAADGNRVQAGEGFVPAGDVVSDRASLLPLSARSPEALEALCRSYVSFLADGGRGAGLSLQDICYTAGARRSHHDYRLAIVGRSRAEFTEQLEGFLRGELPSCASGGRRVAGLGHKFAFVFSGQGTQWLGMARELLAQEPVFRATLEECAERLSVYAGWNLLEELNADEARSRLHETEIAQPAVCAVEVALAALWRSWGVAPGAVVGHSLGEVAAAHVAGVFSLADTMKIVFHRGRLMSRAAGQGRMAALGLTAEECEKALRGYEGRLDIAAVNGPASSVISGDPAALEEVLESLKGRNVFSRLLNDSYAFHSYQMSPLRNELVEALRDLRPEVASVPVYSTVTGGVGDGENLDAAYWGRNLREPVHFAKAVNRLVGKDYDVFIEVGPRPVLSSMISACLEQSGKRGTVLASVRRGEGERASMLASAGSLYAEGFELDWDKVSAGGRCVPLPGYPWQRERYWLEQEVKTASGRRHGGRGPVGTRGGRLLGTKLKDLAHSPGSHTWEIEINRRSRPYLKEHVIRGAAVLPATAYVEMALEAAEELFGASDCAVEELEFQKILFLPDEEFRRVQFALSPAGAEELALHVYSRPSDEKEPAAEWLLHAKGKLSHKAQAPARAPSEVPAEILARLREEVDVSEFYAGMRGHGVEDGPSFRAVGRLWRGQGEALGEVRLPGLDGAANLDGAGADSYHAHPALMASCFQVLLATQAGGSDSTHDDSLYLPVLLRKFVLHRRPAPGRPLWSHAVRKSGADESAGTLEGDIRIFDDEGLLLAEAFGVKFRRQTESVSPDADDGLADLLYELRWVAKDAPGFNYPEAGEKGSWILFLDRGGVGEGLAALLESRGQTCFRVGAGENYSAAENQYTARPDSRQDLERLTQAVLAQASLPLRGVVHLWSLDVCLQDDVNVSSFDEAHSLATASALHLIQTLAASAESGNSARPRAWFATRGAQAAGDAHATLAVGQSLLWGLGRTCAIEHPEFWGGLVDLDPRASEDENASQLLDGICTREREDQIAFRGRRMYVARLARKGGLARRGLTLKPDASYLITGGLDGLGFEVARWMVERGAKHLVLLGRTKLPPRESWGQIEDGRVARRVAGVRELERLNVRVHCAAVDAADEQQLNSFLDSFRGANHPPIKGIVHAASVWEDEDGQSLVRTLARLDRAALEAVFRAKVKGSWLLHKLFAGDELDFLILFSSAASLLGSPGQGNYAAAGAFLDALAQHLRALGRRAFSISWGAVSGAGFGVTPEGLKLNEHWEARGIRSITPAQMTEALGRIVSQDIPHIAVAKMDWRQLRQSYPGMAGLPWATNLIAEGFPKAAGQNESRLRRRLLAAPADEQRRLLEYHLGEQLSLALRLPPSRLDVHQPITNLGFDSLMAVELRNRIQTDLGVVLPVVQLLQGPSVAQLVTFLLEQLPAADSASAVAAATVASTDSRDEVVRADHADLEQLSATLDELSDERVEELLKDLLASGNGEQ
jgi:myxalamid-type polyketide synthase MxaD